MIFRFHGRHVNVLCVRLFDAEPGVDVTAWARRACILGVVKPLDSL